MLRIKRLDFEMIIKKFVSLQTSNFFYMCVNVPSALMLEIEPPLH